MKLAYPLHTSLFRLGRLSAKFRSVVIGIFDPSFSSTFVRLDTDVGEEGLAHSLCSNSLKKCSRPVKSFNAKRSHVEKGRDHHPTVPTKLGLIKLGNDPAGGRCCSWNKGDILGLYQS